MTTETLTPAPPYLVAGSGPYAIPHPYQSAQEIVAFVLDGIELTQLDYVTHFIVTPSQGGEDGDLLLTVSAAAAHAGKTLLIRRATIAEQGWAGVAGPREKGLERQLDRIVQVLQDQAEATRRAIKVPGGEGFEVHIFDPEPGAFLRWNVAGTAIVPGPDAVAMENAAANAAAAEAAAAIAVATLENAIKTTDVWSPSAGDTVTVPGDYPTLQHAVDAILVRSKRRRQRILIQAGHALTAGLWCRDANYRGIRIEAEDAVVPLAAGFAGISVVGIPAVGADPNETTGLLIAGYNADLPTLACVIDMDHQHGCGYACVWGGSGFVAPGGGVINAGYHGAMARNAIMVLHQSDFHGANGSAVRLAYVAAAAAQSSNLSGSCRTPNNSSQGAADVSRTSRLHARLCDMSGSGAAAVAFSRCSGGTVEQSNLSGAAFSGLVANGCSPVSAYGCQINGATGAAGGTGSGRGVLVEDGSVVHLSGSTITGNATKDIELRQGGAAIVDGVTTTSSPSAGVPAAADCNPPQFNVPTNRGVLWNQDRPTVFNMGAFSETGETGGADYTVDSVHRSSRPSTDGRDHMQFYNPNGLVGKIATSGSGTTYSTVSDARLKHDPQPLDLAGFYDLASAIEIVSFEWKRADGTLTGQQGIGVIAQQLQALDPVLAAQFVVPGVGEPGDEDFQPLTVDYGRLGMAALVGMQRQRALIADLTARVAALEAAP
jgi:hypothetical protein